MSRKGKPWRARIAVLLFIILAAGSVWLVARSVPPDPVYGGKPLSVWLQAYDPHSPHGRGSREWNETDATVRHIGTNSIPLLLDWLRKGDSSLKLKLVALARKQNFIKVRFVPAHTRNREASMAFIALGNSARDAVPQLIKIYSENHSRESQYAVAEALGWIGPAANDAVPLLIGAAKDLDVRIRANALWSLGEIHAEPRLCVPVLIRALDDSDASVRLSTVHALGMFGSDAQRAIPALTALTNDPVGTPRIIRVEIMETPMEARKALGKINPHREDDRLVLDPLKAELRK